MPPDVPMTPVSSLALALRCGVVMKAAVLDFVREAEVLHREVTGQEPPVDKVSALQFAMQQECAAVQENPDILAVRDTRFVWDRVSDRILQPALALALGSAAAISETARPWHELFAQIQQLTAEVSPPQLLLEQFRLFQSKLPSFWDRVQTQHMQRQQQDSQRQSAQALAQLAAISSSSASRDRSGAFNRPVAFGPAPAVGGMAGAAAHPVFAALKALDAEWAGKAAGDRGCQYWSGLDGSCRRADLCTDAASHVVNKPSAWYLARARVWQLHGGVRNPANGNWTLPKISGLKRPLQGGEAGAGGGFPPLG